MGTGPAGSVFGENSFYRETWGRDGRYVSKRSSVPPSCLPQSQSSGTGPSASCGYCPLCPVGGGGSTQGKFVLSSPRGVNGHRRPGVQDEGVAMWLNVVQNDTRVTYCKLLVLLPLCPTGFGTRGKSLYRKTWGTRRGGRHVAQLVRVVDIAPFAPRGSVPREKSFYRAPGA